MYATSYALGVYGSLVLLLILPGIVIRKTMSKREVRD